MPESKKEKINKCGIVMPISTIDGCSSEHWNEVLDILKDAIIQADFEPNLVSNADDSGIIQKRIIHNLYSNEIVVCDVSCKNPNVMFELGMRLAFDKPTIIIKDDKTDYSFDTSLIEHLTYPRDLRFSKINKFKESLISKIIGTYKKSTTDSNYTTFLKHFGEYKVAKLTEKEISSDKFIMNAIEDIRKEVSVIRINQHNSLNSVSTINNLNKKELHIAKDFVGNKIKEYLQLNELSSSDITFSDEHEEKIYDFMLGISNTKEICHSPSILKKLIKDVVVPF